MKIGKGNWLHRHQPYSAIHCRAEEELLLVGWLVGWSVGWLVGRPLLVGSWLFSALKTLKNQRRNQDRVLFSYVNLSNTNLNRNINPNPKSIKKGKKHEVKKIFSDCFLSLLLRHDVFGGFWLTNHVSTEQVMKGSESLPKDRHFVFLILFSSAVRRTGSVLRIAIVFTRNNIQIIFDIRVGFVLE